MIDDRPQLTHRDGDLSYSTYSNEELWEAHEGIDPLRYPVNFKNLLDEMAARGIAANDSADHSPTSFAAKMRGIVAIAIVASTLCIFFVGMERFADGPIRPCGVNQYCGKQGQLHSAADYAAFRRWETTTLLLWPFNMLAFAALVQAHAKHRRRK